MEKANNGGILSLSDEKFEILQQKHPDASEASDDILLKETPQEVHPAIYERINSEMVKDAIKRQEELQVFQEWMLTDGAVY